MSALTSMNLTSRLRLPASSQKHKRRDSQSHCRGGQQPVAPLHHKSYLGPSKRSIVRCAAVPDGGLLQQLYDTTQQADILVASQLEGITPFTYVVVLAAGLVTSLSPCTLSVLPLTIGYIGGYSKDPEEKGKLGLQAVSFSAGLATTLAALGVFSTTLGRAYGQIGSGLPVAVSVVAVLMGMNLLEVLPLRLPSVDVDVRRLSVPPVAQSYLAGLTFALAASPCSTPILATLLAYVTTQDDPVQGGALLLAYTSGYVAPLLLAATFTVGLHHLKWVKLL